jgi:hypothetical protein
MESTYRPEKVVILFISYMTDSGIRAQMLDSMAGKIGIDAAVEIFDSTIADIVEDTDADIWSYTDETIVHGAPSLELLVKYARYMDNKVLPAECIPSNYIVGEYLKEFHRLKTEELL